MSIQILLKISLENTGLLRRLLIRVVLTHDFDPTTADAKKLTKANIIVANGLGYDSWMNKLAKSVNKKPV